MWRCIRAVELKRRAAVSTPFEESHRSSSPSRTALDWFAIAKAISVAALTIIASGPAMAGKGGIPNAPNVPNVNLGLEKKQGLGVGVQPLRGASALTPAGGSLPPGHLSTPGLGLGRNGTIGTQPLTPGFTPPGRGLVPSSPVPNSGPTATPLSSSDSSNDVGRAVSTLNGPDAAAAPNHEPLPRRIPVCR